MAVNPENQTMQKAVDTAKSVLLSASAGSGKTRALKERYLALLDQLDNRGLNVDQAVAITFTDKAAAEIKERVMRDLPETMLKKIIRGRQDLRISTIHSFCMNLLKRYPLEAGLPPDFGVLDTGDQAFKIQKAIEDALEESDIDPSIMAPLREFTVSELIATIDFLLSIRSRLKRMEIDAGGPDSLLRSLSSGMEIAPAEAELSALIAGAEWCRSFREMERLLRAEGDNYTGSMGPGHLLLSEEPEADVAFRTTSALAPVYFTLEGAPRKSPKLSAKAFHAKADRPRYEKLFFDIQTLLYRFRNAFLRARAGRETISMLRLYLRAEERYQEAKLREGLLDFDDLEIYAYRLLQNTQTPDILYWLDRKILHFLVDEFQDTSDIQWAILDKLTAEIFSGQGADKRMPPTLFVVGDEKQSIYRFREANYRLLEGVRRRMESRLPPDGRELLTLDRNFRSTRELVETVNRVFAGLWGESYKPSLAHRKDHRGSARLIKLLPVLAEGPPSGPSEAEVLARAIQRLIADKTVIHEKTGEQWSERAAGYADCAILIQSRTRLKEYEAALQEEHIPYRVVGGIGFYEEDEVRALMNLLFFLWNSGDKLSLVAALKSPLFGLQDKDLFDLMQDSNGLTQALRAQNPETWQLLHSWQKLAGLVPLATLLHTIMNDTGAYIRFGRKNPQALFNLDKLLDTAREFDRRGYTTLQDFVERVRNIRLTEQREATADMNLPGFQGSISILTVHKAKGLEYPVIFLPGMNQAARSLTIGPGALIEEAYGKKRMALKGADNPIYEDLWKGENGEQEELMREHQRLLYVAMTRARDHLIMLGTLGTGASPIKQNTWLDYLLRAIPTLRENSVMADTPVTLHKSPEWKPEPMTGTAPSEQQALLPEEPLASPDTTVALSIVMKNLSPLPLSELSEWKRATDFIDRDKEASIEAIHLASKVIAVSPLTRGLVLHRCLEEYTKTGAFDIHSIMHEYPEISSLGLDAQRDFSVEVEAVLRSVLGNNELSWIFERHDKAWSELPFLYKKGQSLISGVIDRVLVKNGKGFVIDYKSIFIENETGLASWKEHYRPQLGIYCEAIKEIFRLESVEGYLLFLDSNRLELTSRIA